MIPARGSWECGAKARARARMDPNLRATTKMVEKKFLQPSVVPMVATSWHSNFGSTSFNFFATPYYNACKGARARARAWRPVCLDPGLEMFDYYLILIHPWWLHNEAIRTSLEPVNPKMQAF